MNKKDTSKLGLGLVIGSVIGGVAAAFLSPKSGKENRELVSQKVNSLKTMIDEKKVQEKVKQIFGDVSEEGTKMYTAIQKELTTKLDDMKKNVDEIDMNKYRGLVDDVFGRVKTDSQQSSDMVAKLKNYFMGKWGEAKEIAKEDAKEAKHKAHKAVKEMEEEV